MFLRYFSHIVASGRSESFSRVNGYEKIIPKQNKQGLHVDVEAFDVNHGQN